MNLDTIKDDIFKKYYPPSPIPNENITQEELNQLFDKFTNDKLTAKQQFINDIKSCLISLGLSETKSIQIIDAAFKNTHTSQKS